MLDEELIQIFLQETWENIQMAEEGLLQLENNPDDVDSINGVFRAMHTIKGGAGLMGFSEISDVAHHLENLLEHIRQREKQISKEAFVILFAGIDLIKQMLVSKDFVVEDIAEQLEDIRGAIDLLIDSNMEKTIRPAEISDKHESSNFYKITLKFRHDIFETGTDPLMLLYELTESGNFLENYIYEADLPTLEKLDPHEFHLVWTIFLESVKEIAEINDIFIFIQDENHVIVEDITDNLSFWFGGGSASVELLIDNNLIGADMAGEVAKRQALVGQQLLKRDNGNTLAKSGTLHKWQENMNTIRVDSNKIENILNQLAELLIAQSRVKELVTNIPNLQRNISSEISNAFAEVDKIVCSVQEEVMKTSMIPIGGTFSRFQRMARDLAKEKGKEVDLILKGKETEIDKKVIEQMADPLKHLIRNAIDHGLETAEERVAQGKPPKGKIELNAFHQEGNFVIEISDDGRGIDQKVVLAKALEKGLADSNRTYLTDEIYEFLFMSGFSTAKEITDISGRGVGLDVVMANISNLQGKVELYSEKGKGSKFSIQLPLTLAIIDGMMIRLGEEKFVIPLNFIVEFIKARPENITRIEGKGLIVQLRNEFIPYKALYQLLNLKATYEKPTDGILIILKEGSKKLALLVDEIIGQEQVVIKSMRENLEQVDGIAGATILGDGKVAIILDILSLFRIARR